jgi:hypothetical protein
MAQQPQNTPQTPASRARQALFSHKLHHGSPESDKPPRPRRGRSYIPTTDGVRLHLWTLPTTGLLLIPQAIYEHGESWWNDVDIGNPTSSHLVANRWNMRRMNLALQSTFIILASDFLHVIKSYDMEPPALLPRRRKACCGFLSPLKSIALAGFDTRTLGLMAVMLYRTIISGSRSLSGFHCILITFNRFRAGFFRTPTSCNLTGASVASWSPVIALSPSLVFTFNRFVFNLNLR